MEYIFVTLIVITIIAGAAYVLLAGTMLVYYAFVIWPFTALVAGIVIGIITESAALGFFWGVVIGVVGWGINKIIRDRSVKKVQRKPPKTEIVSYAQVKKDLPEIKRECVEIDIKGVAELESMISKIQTDYEMLVSSNDL